MLVPLLVMLGASLVVVLAVAIAMFLDVVYRGDQIPAERRQAAHRWRPPFARGRELLDWTRETTAQIVAKNLSGEQNGPVELAAEVHKYATRALLPLVPEEETKRSVACPEDGQGMIARQFDLETSAADGNIPPWASHMQTVEQGVEEGLVGELESAGLDANVYELNSALVTALDAPDAAQRGAKGEDVFGDCKLYR